MDLRWDQYVETFGYTPPEYFETEAFRQYLLTFWAIICLPELDMAMMKKFGGHILKTKRTVIRLKWPERRVLLRQKYL